MRNAFYPFSRIVLTGYFIFVRRFVFHQGLGLDGLFGHPLHYVAKAGFGRGVERPGVCSAVYFQPFIQQELCYFDKIS